MWAAYYQFDGDGRYTVAVKKLRHQAEYELEKFVERMTHPAVGIWWVWVEEVEEISDESDFGVARPSDSDV